MAEYVGQTSAPLTQPHNTIGIAPEACSVCFGLNATQYDNSDWKGLRSVALVLVSAWKGCAGCSVLVAVLLPYWEEAEFESFCEYGFRTYKNSFYVEFVKDSWWFPSILEIYTLTESTCPWRYIKPTTAISSDTGSDKAFCTLRGWLKDCTASHDACQRYVRPSKLPRRVVEIIGPNDVKLRVDSTELAHYACVSHCWGGDDFIQTTRTNLSAHMKSIPWESLTVTFQHAIDTSYRLGIRYVWIDSLCILQGDEDDWRREGSKMCEIYSNAYLTIAATHSRNSGGGCYRRSDFRFGQTYAFRNAQGAVYKLHAREGLSHINDYESFRGTPSDSPLLDRAWVYQERLLSPRVVHFSSNELLWECMSLRTCECSEWPGYGTQPHEYDSKKEPVFLERPHMRMDLTPVEFAGRKIRSPVEWKWRRVIEQYSAKTLTHEADIFPALQGIAKFMQQGSAYHAGLWDDDSLLANLTWHTRQYTAIDYEAFCNSARWGPLEQVFGTRPAVWRAPSWSWASITKPIAYSVQFNEHTKFLASVVSVQTTAIGDSFGQLLSGHLQLKGRCVKAMLGNNMSTISKDSKKINYNVEFSRIRPELEDEDIIQLNSKRAQWAKSRGITSLRQMTYVWPRDELYLDYEPKSTYDKEVLLLEMLKWQKDRPTSLLKDQFIYLVFSCVNEANGSYERIGFLNAHRRAASEAFVNDGKEVVLNII